MFNSIFGYFKFAQHCSLTSSPGSPRLRNLSIEGRSVPDYGAPFNYISSWNPALARQLTNHYYFYYVLSSGSLLLRWW